MWNPASDIFLVFRTLLNCLKCIIYKDCYRRGDSPPRREPRLYNRPEQPAGRNYWYCVPLADFCRFIAVLVNNAFKTVQQSAKDKEDICRRANARQRYLTQDFTLWWAGLRCIILENCYRYVVSYMAERIQEEHHKICNLQTMSGWIWIIY